MVISEVFREPLPDTRLAGPVTLLEELQAGIARQLAVLYDAGLTGTGQSSADVLGVPGTVLAERLTGHLVREIMFRGSAGGPLTPLADQLNHDLTHAIARVAADLGLGVHHPLREPLDHLPQHIRARRCHVLLRLGLSTSKDHEVAVSGHADTPSDRRTSHGRISYPIHHSRGREPGSIGLGSYAVDSNSEIDRLLAAQADRVNAVTTRSAGLTAAAALAGSFVSAQLTVKIQVRWWVIVTFGLATLSGVVVLLGTRLETGPNADKLLEWDLLYPGQFADLVRAVAESPLCRVLMAGRCRGFSCAGGLAAGLVRPGWPGWAGRPGRPW